MVVTLSCAQQGTLAGWIQLPAQVVRMGWGAVCLDRRCHLTGLLQHLFSGRAWHASAGKTKDQGIRKRNRI